MTAGVTQSMNEEYEGQVPIPGSWANFWEYAAIASAAPLIKTQVERSIQGWRKYPRECPATCHEK